MHGFLQHIDDFSNENYALKVAVTVKDSVVLELTSF